MTDEKMLEVANKFSFHDIEDMLSAIGFNGITATQICTRLTDKQRKENEEARMHQLTEEVKEVKAKTFKKTPTNGVRSRESIICSFGLPDAVIQSRVTILLDILLAVAVCQYIVRIARNSSGLRMRIRLGSLKWNGKTTVEANYSVEIEITGHDRRGLLNEVLQAISESKTNIAAVSGRTDRNKMAMMH